MASLVVYIGIFFVSSSFMNMVTEAAPGPYDSPNSWATETLRTDLVSVVDDPIRLFNYTRDLRFVNHPDLFMQPRRIPWFCPVNFCWVRQGMMGWNIHLLGINVTKVY